MHCFEKQCANLLSFVPCFLLCAFSVEDLVEYIKKVAEDETLWEKHMGWKKLPQSKWSKVCVWAQAQPTAAQHGLTVGLSDMVCKTVAYRAAAMRPLAGASAGLGLNCCCCVSLTGMARVQAHDAVQRTLPHGNAYRRQAVEVEGRGPVGLATTQQKAASLLVQLFSELLRRFMLFSPKFKHSTQSWNTPTWK